MTRPDLDALQALLDKNPHDGTDAAQALLALPALIARVRELEQWQHDMVEKAAAKSLDGYRELAARAAAAENERDEARAAAIAMRERCAQECDALASVEGIAQRCAAAIRALEP